MKRTTKAFTLVELIVVITILAILGTIAFISLQGYSADARNSKRTSDVNNIISAMSIKMAEGGWLSSFVTATDGTNWGLNLSSTGSYGWTWAAFWTNYFGWVPNYTALGVKAAEFQDPNGQDYKIGATTTADGRYELAASLEEAGARKALVKGNYVPRTTAQTATVATISGKVVTISAADTNKFKTGDIVDITWGVAPVEAQILSVARDGVTLTFAANVATDLTTVALNASETSGLIATRGSAAIPVSNLDTVAANQPY